MSPLHATRAAVGGAWCLALAAIPLCSQHPAVLVAVLAVEAVAALAAGLGRELRRTAAWGVPFAVVVVVINALVTRDGATVVFRGPSLPWPGQIDITLEGIAYGGVLGLRILAIFGTAVFLTAAVDPDELLRSLRRVSLRSGRHGGARDAAVRRPAPRRAPARRRPALPARTVVASRLAIMRAVTAGALDRATDIAATLEVRGFGSGARPPRMHRPWSRHDYAFAASAVALLAIAIGVLAGAWAQFDAYPRLSAPLTRPTLLAIAALVVCALAPFADRRGIVPMTVAVGVAAPLAFERRLVPLSRGGRAGARRRVVRGRAG